MKKIYLLLIITIFLTGCGTKKINSEKTSISSGQIKSYRAKVSIKGNGINENYIVYNDNNSIYEITFIDRDDFDKAIINEEEITIYKENEIVDQTLSYDYKNTDLFLKGLENIKVTSNKTEKIGEEKYTYQEFDFKKNDIEKISETFNIESADGKGYVYINSKNQVYIVNYKIADVNINVSYTRLEK